LNGNLQNCERWQSCMFRFPVISQLSDCKWAEAR